MIGLFLNTKDEAVLLRWNLQFHLDWGFDVIAVADNASTDDTAQAVREFGDAVVYRRYENFGDRHAVRAAMLAEFRDVEWMLVSDTDEFIWAQDVSGPRDLLSEVPGDIVAVNFNQKLFVPTARDDVGQPVFAGREYWAPFGSSLHTSYGQAGKSFYRGSALGYIGTNDHWSAQVPHDRFQHPIFAIHHYMFRSEDQFVDKVARLPTWEEYTNPLKRLKWRVRTRPGELARWVGDYKSAWHRLYAREGEEGLRRFYRTEYTVSEDKLVDDLVNGELVHDADFAVYMRARYGAAV